MYATSGCLPRDPLHFLGLEPGVFQARPGRRLDDEVDLAPVTDGDESRAAQRGLQCDRAEERAQRDQHHRQPVVQRPGDHALIALGLPVEPAVESLEGPCDAGSRRSCDSVCGSAQ